eukprot:1181484-Prorocentrum_minimum.AAC.1
MVCFPPSTSLPRAHPRGRWWFHPPAGCFTPPSVVSLPRWWFHSLIGGFTPLSVVSLPCRLFHSPVGGFTPPSVVSLPRRWFHPPSTARLYEWSPILAVCAAHMLIGALVGRLATHALRLPPPLQQMLVLSSTFGNAGVCFSPSHLLTFSPQGGHPSRASHYRHTASAVRPTSVTLSSHLLGARLRTLRAQSHPHL